MNIPKIELFLGIIEEVVNRETFEIKFKVPGVMEGMKAVPLGRDLDEPVPGNIIIIMSVDPIYYSVNFYSKLKENNFNGFRCNGKFLDITPDYITLGVGEDKQIPDNENPEPTSYIKIDKDGNIEIESKGDITVHSETCTIDSPDVKITGSKLTVNGTSLPSADGSGPFCGIPKCLFTGAPHTGNISTNN